MGARGWGLGLGRAGLGWAGLVGWAKFHIREGCAHCRRPQGKVAVRTYPGIRSITGNSSLRQTHFAIFFKATPRESGPNLSISRSETWILVPPESNLGFENIEMDSKMLPGDRRRSHREPRSATFAKPYSFHRFLKVPVELLATVALRSPQPPEPLSESPKPFFPAPIFPAPSRAPDPGVGGLTGLRPLPPTPKKKRGTPIATVVATSFDVGLRSLPSSPHFFGIV